MQPVHRAGPMGWTRPPRHAWVEKDEADSFDFQSTPGRSTEDLLQNPGTLPPEGREVVYFFQRDCSYMQPATLRSHATHVAREVAFHLAAGAGLVVLFGLSAAFTGGAMGGEAAGLLMGGSLATGLYAGHKNYGLYREAYPQYGERIPGRLVDAEGPTGTRHLTFYPHGQTDNPVRLERYAAASVVPGGEPSFLWGGHGKTWWDGAEAVVKKKLALDPD